MSLSALQFLATAARYAGDNGSKPDSPEALNYLNSARKMLWTQGDWEGTMLTGFIHLNEGCFFLAHPGEIIKNAYIGCSNVPIPILTGSSYWTNVTSLGTYCTKQKLPFFRTGLTYPLLRVFPAKTQLGVAAKNIEDAGKKVTVVYEDQSCGRVVEEIELLDNWGCSYQENGVVNRVISITKPATLGKVQILSKSSSGAVTTIHELSGEEIAPKYQQYQVTAPDCGCIVIRVKKKFIPIQDLGELIDLNEDALEWSMKAVVSKEADDLQGYSTKLKFARDHLQLEKEDFTNSITPSRGVVMGDMVTSDCTEY